ncbi:MAG TPA: 2-oxo acid dehydrogenase subunit E2 [Candidatus Hydrogenedentes bacterium]|nr:2-oxo acid dehydrogenase subunit E2 [Candidatus Hydrogenedentota bacterium]
MKREFRLPELGENVSQGTVGRVLVKPGDVVSAGQNVLEIETDKAVAEIPVPFAGTVVEVRVKEGATVKTGDVVMVLEESAVDATASPAVQQPPEAPAVTEAPVPVAATEKPPVSPAESRTQGPAPVAPPVARTPVVTEVPVTGAGLRKGPVRAAPSVRALARELGVNLEDVPTADPTGRIMAADVMAWHQRLQQGAVVPPPAVSESAGISVTAAPQATPEVSLDTVVRPDDGMASLPGEAVEDRWGPASAEPMNAVRRKTAEHMTACWETIPHVTHFDKADITALDALRLKYARAVEKAGGRLTITSFVLKALPFVLKQFPKFNASVDMAGQRVIYKGYYHIGVAVDTPTGLLVPVLRDVDRKSITQLSVELPAVAARARERKLSLEDMQGGTFTVSNLGGLGGYAFTPIINAPEVAILGMSRAQYEPVWSGGQFAPRLMLPFSLSYDHRLIDGADAARFLRRLIEILENPWVLFMEA